MSDSENEIENQAIDNEQKEDDDVTPEEKESIRSEISTMSFEDLLKLKEKIGTKVYNETVFGANHKQSLKANFKRVNKNRPREMSSKKRVNIKQEISNFKKPSPRDPRFGPLCGTFNEKIFKTNYKFVYDMRKNEHKQLETELESSEDPEDRKKIKYLMQRLSNQIREHEKNEKEKAKIEEEKQEVRTKLKNGQVPIYKKKSEKRMENLIEKYEELKKTNQLEKHIKKRTQKLVIKEKKKLNKIKF